MADEIRLLPEADDPAMVDGLQARLHDPLWMLGRQWQFGELDAEDAASPAGVELETQHGLLSRYRPADGTAVDLAAGPVPWEPLVEAEPTPGPTYTSRLEAGAHFLHLLDQAGATQTRSAYRTAFTLAPPADDEMVTIDEAGQRRLRALTGRALDGERLVEALAEGLPAAPAVPAAERDRVVAVAAAWSSWYADRGRQPAAGDGAWRPDRMEYRFTMSGRLGEEELALQATEFDGGSLDWPALDRAPGGLEPTIPSTRRTARLLPTPVTYRGMPVDRLWTFEDGQVNLAAVPAGETDAARLAMLWFALIYSNDWFLLPLEVAAGSVTRVQSLFVTDTFGRRTRVPDAATADGPDASWRMFAPTGAPEVLVVPAGAPSSLDSEPLEDVLLVRDELANLCWAIERTVEGRAGGLVDRYQESLRAAQGGQPTPTAPTTPAVHYRLGEAPPANWLPLVPDDTERATLRVGHLPAGVVGAAARPLGLLLVDGLTLYEEEVPREGRAVLRRYRRARGPNGSTHLWVGRQKSPGRGEASSGLRFDSLE